MENAIITFETAKLAKEKGFDEEFADFYTEQGELFFDIDYPSLQPTKPDLYYSAPEQSLLQRWLREKHNISTEIFSENDYEKENKTIWIYILSKINQTHIKFVGENRNEDYDTYEQALEAGLSEALTLI